MLPEAQLHAAPQLHAGPQAQLASCEADAEAWLQLQDLVSNSLVIGASLAVRI